MLCRKFADIGHTVQLQYCSPWLCLSSGWAELVTCHALPGSGVIEGLRGVAKSGSGCVVVAEMSSQGSLTSSDYTKGALYNYVYMYMYVLLSLNIHVCMYVCVCCMYYV